MYSDEFFSVSAQLIPVLFLGLVVEERLRDEQETPGDRVLRSFILAGLILSEVMSLGVVSGGIDNGRFISAVVAQLMLLSGGLIASAAIGRELVAGRGTTERIGHFVAVMIVLVTIVSMGIAIGF